MIEFPSGDLISRQGYVCPACGEPIEVRMVRQSNDRLAIPTVAVEVEHASQDAACRFIVEALTDEQQAWATYMAARMAERFQDIGRTS